LISPDGGIHRRHHNCPKPVAKRKESWLVYNTPAKELEERKRFGIAAAAREILKEMLSLPLYMYQKLKNEIQDLIIKKEIENKKMEIKNGSQEDILRLCFRHLLYI